MMPPTLPLFAAPIPDVPIAWWRGARVSRSEFLTHVQRVEKTLARSRFVLNLCENRYLFLVAFAAIVASGKTNLLPPSRAAKEAEDIAAAYPDNQSVADPEVEATVLQAPAGSSVTARDVPPVPADHLAAVVFTSGSTGLARAHDKHWGDLVQATRCAERRFGFDRHAGAAIVATVPAQHMYGLETSILVPLLCEVGVYGTRPFYAEDVRAALAAVPAPRVLITTPVHLRVCVESALKWPAVEFVISATAPLTQALAAQAERAFGAPVLEIYGCTEIGSIASRRRLDGDLWQTYDGMSVVETDGGFYVQARHLSEPVALNDVLIVRDATHFELTGRQADLVNIAGKRASLSDLTIKLNEIEGVQDAVFVAPDGNDERTPRLTALVVAPGLKESDILKALAERVDPAFLPRPLYKVERLPRNALGKLPRAEVLTLVQQLKRQV
jgi:Acyl-coenzyme A synthetases/AMP-(fatty) acid ligases